MKIAAITKFKHGMLYEALQKLEWSQHKLAQEIGTYDTIVSSLLLLKYVPSKKLATKIQAAFGRHGYFFDLEKAWPTKFVALKKSVEVVQIQDVDPLFLTTNSGCYLEAPAEYSDLDPENISAATARLEEEHPKLATVLKDRFWGGLTLDQIGDRLGVTRERARQMENEGLLRLRSLLGHDGSEWALATKRAEKAVQRNKEMVRRAQDEEYKRLQGLKDYFRRKHALEAFAEAERALQIQYS